MKDRRTVDPDGIACRHENLPAGPQSAKKRKFSGRARASRNSTTIHTGRHHAVPQIAVHWGSRLATALCPATPMLHLTYAQCAARLLD